jgi:hypothetical protein
VGGPGGWTVNEKEHLPHLTFVPPGLSFSSGNLNLVPHCPHVIIMARSSYHIDLKTEVF